MAAVDTGSAYPSCREVSGAVILSLPDESGRSASGLEFDEPDEVALGVLEPGRADGRERCDHRFAVEGRHIVGLEHDAAGAKLGDLGPDVVHLETDLRVAS